MRTRGKMVAFSVFLLALNYSVAAAKEKGKSGFGCSTQMRVERLEGSYRSWYANDRFSNSELGLGLGCFYRYGRFSLDGGAEITVGDLFITHEDQSLDLTLYAPQQSPRGWFGLTVSVLKRLDIGAHARYRVIPETKLEITDLWIKSWEGTGFDFTTLGKKHVNVQGSLQIWEAGGTGSFQVSSWLSTSLDVMWQRYTLDLEASLDAYASNILKAYGGYLEDVVAVGEDADFVLFTPEVTVCPYDRVCASVSMPLAIMGEDRWLRGVSLTLSAPLF
jgi:hypothetical protein